MMNPMTKFHLIVFILALGVIKLFGQTGYLQVSAPDSGLAILLNDSLIGKTPAPAFEIKQGSYEITVTNPQKGYWRSNDYTEQVTINAGEMSYITPTFKKNYILCSTPFGAQVYLNQQHIGSTPLYFETASSIGHILMIKKLDFEPHIINLDTVKSHNISIQLVPIKAQQPIPGLENGNSDQEITINKKIAYSLFAFTLTTGFTAAYLKDRADKKYSEYLSASGISEMNELYDDTKRLDHYSSISLGLFEVSFVFSLYYLIKKTEY